MGKSGHFSTRGLSGSAAVDAWAEHWHAVVALGVRPLGPTPFRAEVQGRQLGQLGIGRIAVGAHAIERLGGTPHHAAGDRLKLVMQISGTTVLEQGGESCAIGAGQWVIYDMARPYRLSNQEPTRQMAMMVPRDAFAGLADTARRIGVQPRPIAGMARLLRRCGQGVLDDLQPAMDGAESDGLDSDLGGTMLDLMRLTLGECSATLSRTSMQDTMRARVAAYIRHNFRDPDLSLDTVAAAMRCTKRYLHKLFRDDETICEHIWALRLGHCAQDLAAPAKQERSITEIAFANGFSNSSHFSRVFKARYGTSPRAFRHGARKNTVGEG